MPKILYLVVPCYNEEEVLLEAKEQLVNKLVKLIEINKINKKSRIVFVNDGSKDSTWELIRKFSEENEHINGINLSRNRGHQNALLAGLLAVKDEADMVISLDADLQDDIHAIDEMVDKYYAGAEIVYGVRAKRKKDTFFKRVSAESFYRLMDFLGANTVFNHADYRLMGSKSLTALEGFGEVNLFLRGIIPLIGYRSDYVYYERKERFAGESKYPLSKMLAFAIEGITSLSIKPLRMISVLGLSIFAISILYFFYIIFQYFTGNTIQGWSSVAASVWLMGGLILLSLSIVGEYIGKIYLEVKKRPRYIIDGHLKGKKIKEEKKK
ncbi:bactoprenol glucosyl transferase [Erysipelotrichaceae bacterium]|nr:bactoprenol glucosyl transferase [Erysipelotrichaceae bacterium]